MHLRPVGEQALQVFALLQLIVSKAKKLEGLVVSDEAAFDAQALVSDFFANFIETVKFGLLALRLVPPQLLAVIAQ